MAATGVIVLAHGSRGERGKHEVRATLDRIAAGLRPMLSADTEIIGAALQFNHPDFEDAVASLSEKGVKRIIIAPYFLFAGRHITEDIPQLTAKLQNNYPQMSFIMADNLGMDAYFVSIMAKRVEQAAPDLARSNGNFPGPIEQASMRIVDSLLPPLQGLSEDEITVVKRIVHASGDPGVARSIRFSRSAVDHGISAIGKGSPIYTDVRMVTAGINRRQAGAFGCSITCALDEAAADGDTDGGETTRTAAGMRRLGMKPGSAIVAIGNAPTALLALLDLIDNSGIKPALVVGMPVGFVRAEESKQALMKRDVPYITVTGTRGGSAMAAATVNSLLRMAADRKVGKA